MFFPQLGPEVTFDDGQALIEAERRELRKASGRNTAGGGGGGKGSPGSSAAGAGSGAYGPPWTPGPKQITVYTDELNSYWQGRIDGLKVPGKGHLRALTYARPVPRPPADRPAPPPQSLPAAGGPAAAPRPVTITLREFQKFPLPKPKLVVNPPGQWALINMPTYVAAADEPVTFEADLLGQSFTITAAPVEWAWDFGDGGTLETTKPGKPYPDAIHSHTYVKPGDYTIRLTTTWSGTYRAAGGPVRQIEGTTTTSVAHGPIRLYELHNKLIPPGE